MNDEERADYVSNDEGLYDMWKRSRLSLRDFVRKNRQFIDEVMGNIASGSRRQHYLKYDPLPAWIKKTQN